MNDQLQQLKNAHQFADTAYRAAMDSNSKDLQKELKHIVKVRAAEGTALSGGMAVIAAEAYAGYIDGMLRQRLEGLMEGFDLYGVALDDDLAKEIADEVIALRGKLLTDCGRAHDQTSIVVRMHVSHDRFIQLIESECKESRASIETQIQRRRLTLRKDGTVTNVYHVHGHNSRFNTNATDNSVNTVAVSEDQLFSILRENISSGVRVVETQKDILGKLALLEQSQESASFAKRYAEFIGAAANHMELIAPFIPALTDMLHKVL